MYMETAWNEYWSDKKQHPYWSESDPAVIEVMSLLNKTQIRDVLDLGCGIGRHAFYQAKMGFKVTALDSSPAALKVLKKSVSEAGLSIKTCTGNYNDPLFKPAAFDFILAFNVIYHGSQADFEKSIDLVFEWLRPGGHFFFTCPSRRDAKYGNGELVEAHTFKPMNSVTPGDIHYFTDEAELTELTRRFSHVSRSLYEHDWDNQGQPQFSSYWRVLAVK
jgi:tellurite methyltransferase